MKNPLFILDVENTSDAEQQFELNGSNPNLKVEKTGNEHVIIERFQIQAQNDVNDIVNVHIKGHFLSHQMYVTLAQKDFSVCNCGPYSDKMGKVSESQLKFTIKPLVKVRFVFIPKRYVGCAGTENEYTAQSFIEMEKKYVKLIEFIKYA